MKKCLIIWRRAWKTTKTGQRLIVNEFQPSPTLYSKIYFKKKKNYLSTNAKYLQFYFAIYLFVHLHLNAFMVQIVHDYDYYCILSERAFHSFLVVLTGQWIKSMQLYSAINVTRKTVKHLAFCQMICHFEFCVGVTNIWDLLFQFL